MQDPTSSVLLSLLFLGTVDSRETISWCQFSIKPATFLMLHFWWPEPRHPILIAALQWSEHWVLWDVRIQGCWDDIKHFLSIFHLQNLKFDLYNAEMNLNITMSIKDFWFACAHYEKEFDFILSRFFVVLLFSLLWGLWLLFSDCEYWGHWRDQAVSGCPWNACRRRVCDVTLTCSFLWHLLFPFKGELKLNAQFKYNV